MVKAHFSAIIRAAGGKLLTIPGAVSGSITIYNFVGTQFGWPTMDWWVVVCIVAGLMFFWTFAGLIFRVVQLEDSIKPALQIEYAAREPWVRIVPGTFHFPTGPVVDQMKWFRIKVSSTRRGGTTKGCVVQITNIEHSPDGITFSEVPSSCPQQIAWSADVAEGMGARDIGFGAGRFADVISVDRYNQGAVVKRRESYSVDEPFLARPGVYRLTVVATPSEGGEDARQFLVRWNGDWEQTQMEMTKS